MGNRGKLISSDLRVFPTSDRGIVSGEPSIGTIRKHIVGLVDTDPDILLTPVPCAGEVSSGCRMVLLHIDVDSTGAAEEIHFYDDAGAGAGALWSHYETDSGNADDHDQVIVGLDFAKKFYYQAGHVNVNSLDIDMIGYWD